MTPEHLWRFENQEIGYQNGESMCGNLYVMIASTVSLFDYSLAKAIKCTWLPADSVVISFNCEKAVNDRSDSDDSSDGSECEGPELSEYEKLRLRNITRNQRVMRELGLAKTSPARKVVGKAKDKDSGDSSDSSYSGALGNPHSEHWCVWVYVCW